MIPSFPMMKHLAVTGRNAVAGCHGTNGLIFVTVTCAEEPKDF
jgi:hypothetical protein